MGTDESKKDILLQLAKMLRWKRSNKYLAEKLNVDIKKIPKLKKEARKIKYVAPTRESEGVKKEDFIKGTLESTRTTDFEPKNHTELAELHDVDLSTFIIVNYWSKQKSSGKFTSSIFCKRKTAKDYTLEDFAEFLKGYKPEYTIINKPTKLNRKDTVDIEVSISDYHLAKMYFNNKDSDINKRAETFFKIVTDLVSKVRSIYEIDNIIFPISNDFFHTDTYWNTTTKGTPQDVIAPYDQEYEVGFDLLVKSIIFLKENCQDLTVVLVPGNHDQTKSYYLAHGLNVYFKEQPNITFIRDTDPVKGVVVGNTFIGYHHGNCKIDELPLLFATSSDYCTKFGKAKFREVHTGDKHHYMAKEIKGVRIQQMPSLSGDDKWHKNNNYVNNVRAALVLLYDKIKGKVGEFEERI